MFKMAALRLNTSVTSSSLANHISREDKHNRFHGCLRGLVWQVGDQTISRKKIQQLLQKQNVNNPYKTISDFLFTSGNLGEGGGGRVIILAIKFLRQIIVLSW